VDGRDARHSILLVLETCRDKPYEVTDMLRGCQPVEFTEFPQEVHDFSAFFAASAVKKLFTAKIAEHAKKIFTRSK
jgi:hypothetical protein